MKQVTKRDGSVVPFNKNKIVTAIEKAMACSKDGVKHEVSQRIADVIEAVKQDWSVEQIQDKVEELLMESDCKEAAREYIRYRYIRQQIREHEKANSEILEIIESANDYVNTENSNKNPKILSTQRDYMAGSVSKEITNRMLLPPDIAEAHRKGIIHFHDADYFAQHMHNCCLVNLEDMLQNGTVINGTMIEKPHSFATACNIATQIMAQVASNQYGGQSESLSALAPFVDTSRQNIRKDVRKEFEDMLDAGEISSMPSDQRINDIAEKRLKKEIKGGVQTMQYQINTLMTTNGQTPFVTIFMYLDEVPEGRMRDDLAMIIEEVVRQRTEGTKNEKGVWITPAFPKLIYVLDEDNVYEGSKYWYLTRLCAKCTAKRLVPDYISAKKMREYKLSKGETPGNGDVYPCMGCVTGDEVVAYKVREELRVESFERMWMRFSAQYPVHLQPGREKDKYIDLPDHVTIYDNKLQKFTPCKRIIKNEDSDIVSIKFSNGRCIDCTPDHPFETENRGVVSAEHLKDDDLILADKESKFALEGTQYFNPDMAWVLGVLLCDSSYSGTITLSIAKNGEDEIQDKFGKVIKDYYGLDTNCKIQERGVKGSYKDISIVSDGTNIIQRLCDDLTIRFGGRTKANRHIPSEVFTWNTDARLSFLAGMIDADGYINGSHHTPCVQIGSTNKELALQQMLLAQSLGMTSSVYQNHYRGKSNPFAIRYHVTFIPTKGLVEKIVCKKKRDLFESSYHTVSDSYSGNKCTMTERNYVGKKAATYDVTTGSEHFMVSGIYSHNCRSFLTPDVSGNGWDNIANAKDYDPNKPKYYGRFNQGVVTINLVDVALSSGGDFDKFWKIFDERLELCHRALQIRHKRLEGTPSDVSPIHWQYGALARLKKGEKIDKLLHGGYSTISLGYAGLYECCKYMTGKSHTDPEAKPFALKVMQHMNDKCNEWKSAEDIAYSLYGSPIEATTFKFAQCLKDRFGIVPGITDHDYITNSYHVNVREHIDAFTKLKFESEFQKLSPGGAISYVETSNLTGNPEAVLAVMQFIYNNIIYAELNTKSDYCQVCGYDGEIKVRFDEDKKQSIWYCPNCGNTDQSKMNVARRTCGQ